ncbi:MAG: 3-phosphoshikimate 1-carboxyvinyltransferase [Myxococcota bacterium]
MSVQTFGPLPRLEGTATVPGDKSLSHRALLLSALADGPTDVTGLGTGGDIRSTAAALRALGVDIQFLPHASGGPVTRITGRSPRLWRAPTEPLDCGNSGTTLRLLTGVLAGAGLGQGGLRAVLTGDESLRSRPMGRVARPLREMGARIDLGPRDRAPVTVIATELTGRHHDLPVASAQVKTALLLAGLQADGETVVREPHLSRDHTERMLRAMGAPIESRGTIHRIRRAELSPLGRYAVAGDPSSAAFLIVAALLHPRGDVKVNGVCLNPGRVGFLRVLERMGARVEVDQHSEVGGEPVGSLWARTSALHATDLDPDEVPGTIDELPILALAAAGAEGVSCFRGLAELRVKESDRLARTAHLLQSLGVQVEEGAEELTIHGLGSAALLQATAFDAGLDHRMAMTAAVAGWVGAERVDVTGWSAVATSFPGFAELGEWLS